MSMMADLKKVLGKLKADCNADVAAIVSRNGIPIAYEAPEGSHMDTFSTLSATILGAAEVIYSGLKKDKPEWVMVQSPSGVMIGKPIGAKAILVVVSKLSSEQLSAKVDEATESIKEVLKYER